MDPHKRSATIEVMTGEETIVGGGRFGTDRNGYAAMATYAKQWTDRVWAIEGCQGIDRRIANRLLADGEEVVDVPSKLSARAGCSPPVRAARPTLPRDVAGKARRRVAAELVADLERVHRRSKEADKELKELVAATGTT